MTDLLASTVPTFSPALADAFELTARDIAAVENGELAFAVRYLAQAVRAQDGARFGTGSHELVELLASTVLGEGAGRRHVLTHLLIGVANIESALLRRRANIGGVFAGTLAKLSEARYYATDKLPGGF